MANIEIRAVESLAGTGVPYAYAVKAGPWLFLTGHEAFDFATGHAPEVEGHAGFPDFGAPRLKREAEYILKRMRATLAEFGSDFRHSMRVDQYYPVFEAVRAYQLARHGEFGDYIPPSTSVLMERLFKADSHISMSMIAVVPGKDYEIKKLYPKDVPVPVGSFFVPAITCNDFVFVAGQMASDENALDASVRLPKETRNWGGPNAVQRQTEFIIKKPLEPALKARDSPCQNVLKAQIYVPTARDIPDALDVWQQHVPHRSEEHTSELQSRVDLVCRLLLEKKKKHEIVLPLARDAVAAGADGIIVEVQPRPEEALSEGPQQIPVADFPDFAYGFRTLAKLMR